MSEAGPSPPATRKVPIKLDLPEGVIDAEIELPDGAMRFVELAFEMLQLSNVVVGIGERQVGKLGRKVSCAAGCGACCRQLVPLSPPEASMMAELVETTPEPRRGAIRERFARALEKLEEAGLAERLDHLNDASMSDEENEAVTRAYFGLQIACPFLENESCSIYEARPSVCREYLVTSPAGNCSDPYTKLVERIPISVRLSEALTRLWASLLETKPRLVPLVMALRWDERNPSHRRIGADARELLQRLLGFIGMIAVDAEERAEQSASAPTPPKSPSS